MNPLFITRAIPESNRIIGAFIEKSSEVLCYYNGLQLIKMRG